MHTFSAVVVIVSKMEADEKESIGCRASDCTEANSDPFIYNVRVEIRLY